MKISYGMIVFNGDYVLKEAIDSIYNYAHEIVIVEGPVSKNQELGHVISTDNTISIIENYNDVDNKIKLISGKWKDKDEMCDVYLKQMTGDYVWHVDSDEIYRPEDIEKVIAYLKKNKDTCYSMSFRLRSFYGGLERYISGFDENFEVHRIKKIVPHLSKWKTHRPPTMIWPLTNKYCKDMGHVNHYTTDKWGIRLFHYSFVFPKQVKEKTEYYEKRFKDLITNYWDKLFVPWMRAETDSEKIKVEAPTKGVHMWLPHRRGPAFTAPFTGKHPDAIEKSRDQIEERIREECKTFGIK